MSAKAKSRLNSWKEVADFLGTDVRTAIGWEKEKGLPVHRLKGSFGSSICAFTHEIDAWHFQNIRRTRPEDQPAEAPMVPKLALMRRSRIAGFCAVIVAALASVSAMTSYLSGQRTPPGKLVRVTHKGRVLTAWDESNRVAWAHILPDPAPGAVRTLFAGHIQDMDGTGDEEALVVTKSAKNPRDAEFDFDVQCFSRTGKPLWRYRFEEPLAFAGEDFLPPWELRDIQFLRIGGKSQVCLIYKHSKGWPGVLVTLDSRGMETARFVNSGSIQSVLAYNSSNGGFLLAGGESRSGNSAMMAVLPPERASGVSPESGDSPFKCVGGPDGTPSQYFIFPPSEISLSGARGANRVRIVDSDADGIYVCTVEYEVSPAESAEAVYVFTPALELREVRYNETYWKTHAALEAEGKILHNRDECRTASAVKVWDPTRGWRKMGLDGTLIHSARDLHETPTSPKLAKM